MSRYLVTTVVQFSKEVEADSKDDAEAIGWEWEDELHYDYVESIDVKQLDDEDDEDE